MVRGPGAGAFEGPRSGEDARQFPQFVQVPNREPEHAHIDWGTLRGLAGVRTGHGCAISFYLDLDPHVSPTTADARTRMRALLPPYHDPGGARPLRKRLTHLF